MANWVEDSTVFRRKYRKCDLLWLNHALTSVKRDYQLMEDKYVTLTMEQWFPRMLSHWCHRGPILRMNQRQLIDSIFGFEWCLFCNLYQRTVEEDISFDQIKLTVEVLKFRSYLLAVEELPKEVINIEEYTVNLQDEYGVNHVNRDDGGEREDENDAYHSDNEERIKNKIKPKRIYVYNPNHGNKDLKRSNLAFAFDVNSTFHSIDVGLSVYCDLIDKYGIKPGEGGGVDLGKIRCYLKRCIHMKQTVIQARKKWQCDLLVLQSHNEIYFRKSNKPKKLVSEIDIIMNKHITLTTDLIPKNLDKEFLIPPNGIDIKQWIRVNTDSTFQFISSQLCGGDMYRYLICKQEELIINKPKRFCIFRIRLLNRWALYLPGETHTYHYDSFTKAFIHLRIYMIKNGMSPIVNRKGLFEDDQKRIRRVTVDLSQFDDKIF